MRHSLRARIFAVCFAVSTGVSVLFGTFSLWILEGLEFEQIDLMLHAELNRFMSDHELHPEWPPPQTSYIEGSSAPLHDLASLPAPLGVLEPGYHELEIGTREYRVAIAEHAGYRFVMRLDLALTHLWEDRVTGFIITLMVVCSLLGALLGRHLAHRVLEPITRLAERVTGEIPSSGGEPFASGQRDDEIGRLAQALDDHVQHLRTYAAREQEFTAHASHELRTPLAVAASAVELLLADPQLDETVRRRLQGAERSLQSMHETVETLLALARGETGTDAEVDIDVARLLDEVVAECRTLTGTRRPDIEVSVEATPQVRAPPGALRIVVRNLVANAIVHGGEAAIRLRLCATGITVADNGAGIPAQELARVRDRHFRGRESGAAGSGLGLAIVERICRRHGWQFDIGPGPERGTVASLSFGTERAAEAEANSPREHGVALRTPV